MSDSKKLFSDQASVEMYEKAKKDSVDTAFDRAAELKACPIGAAGDCCKHCGMGPCRVPEPKSAGAKRKVGLCGATAETISARNFLRMIAAGSAAHFRPRPGRGARVPGSGRGARYPATASRTSRNLLAVALDFGVAIEGQDTKAIAIEVGEKALAMFGQQEGEILYVKKAPQKRQEIWRREGVAPPRHRTAR